MQANQGFHHQKKVPISAARLLEKVKEHVFDNCYSLIKSINISLPLSIILLTIEELQKFAIISRLASNPNISQSPQMVYVDQVSRYLLLDFSSLQESSQNILSILLTIGQLIITLCYIIPIKSQGLRQILSKFMVTLFQNVLVIPSLLISANCLSLGINSYINVVLLQLSLVNIVVYKSMQFECSFEREVTNVLVRVPRSMTQQLVGLLMIILFPVLNNTMYPISFLIYLFINFGVIAFQWWEYLKTFTYFEEYLSNLKGVLLSINISSHICYIAINVFGNAIISENVVLFISTFSIFLANFFVVFRNSITKNTIINQDLKGQHQTAIFAVFYWHCYKKIAIKKNELYISSLLKKHTNECEDVTCCCKNRPMLYDANLRIFGNPKLQPHNDRIFIRHYIRRIIMKGCEEHSKSIMLHFLLIIYDIEAIEMITHAMELIKKLSRMEQKKKLNFSERFLLYCIKQTIRDKIVSINLKRGNLDLENVKKFDEKLLSLQMQLRTSVKLYYSLWKHLNRLKLDEAGLYGVCKNALEVMFDMEKVYDQLKEINKQSTELKGIMLFYARMVVHDIHLLSQIRKEIKSSHFRNVIIGSLDQISIKIFGPKTTSLISLQNGKIRWSSKNAHIIFQYPLDQFHGLTIKNLMPKYFAQKHDLYIQKWKETGHHIKLNKTSYAWGNNKDGTIFSTIMFVKVIPLLAEQDYAFFSCIEKLDDQNEVICTSAGEILGAGKLFPSALGIDPRNLQEIQPNIQIFMPYLFDYFLQYFFPKNQSLKNAKQHFQMRREGYFPQNLIQIMEQITYDRLLFKKNHINKQNFQAEYLNFVRLKMQQLTCNVSGNYISFIVRLFKTIEVFRDKTSILCLKVSTPKRDNVERFYTELQKIINKLQHLTEELSTKGMKTTNKKNKSDFFKAFLNPRRVKQLKQRDSLRPSQDGEVVTEPDKSLRTDSYGSRTRKSPQNLVRHRKLLALGAQTQIKNQRVRYNLWKIKKMLHEQGVISRYTYNLLIGKKESSNVIQQVKSDSIKIKDEYTKTLQDPFEEQVASLDDHVSKYGDDDDGSQREMADKDNDNQTFNSASSSATFISMTNQVKMFKNELRSLNSPRPLLVLNILVISLVLSQIGGIIYQMMNNSRNIELGLLQFQLNTQANELVSYLMQAQLNMKDTFSSIPVSAQFGNLTRNYFLYKSTILFQSEMSNRNVYKKQDPSLLDFLDEIVHDSNSLKIKEFFQFIIEQIVENNFIFVFNYFIETVDVITNTFKTMSFTPKIKNEVLVVFVSYLLLNLCFLLFTLPIVYKIQVKIKEIYSLLTKISPKQKHKFYKHYRQLEEEFKKHQNIDHEELSNMLANYEGKMKMFKYSQAISEEQKEQKSEVDLKQSKKKEKEIKTLSADRSIYVKIMAIYLILFSSVILYYVFNNNFIKVYQKARQTFSEVFNQKAQLSQSFTGCIYQLRGYKTSITCNNSDMEVVNSIYNTLRLPNLSPEYVHFATNFVNGSVCNNISQLISFSNSFTETQLQSICTSLNHGTFKLGAINNLYYCQRKIEYQYKTYAQSAATNATTSNTTAYLQSQQFLEITQAFFFNTFFVGQLFEQIQQEMGNQAALFRMSLMIGAYGCLALIIVFITLWLYIFTRLGESASYINAFLLLIPFDVLSENPYIKLYVKNEFDYKASSY